MRATQSIQHRLMLFVSLGLLLFALLSGALAYHLGFTHELEDAASLERQLVRTIQAQAEVAAYAANTKIAEEVVEGLRANPRIRAVRISNSTAQSLNVSAGFASGDPQTTLTDYPLLSPVNGEEKIGTLVVARNDALIRAEATLTAIRQVLWVLLQIVVTALLLILVFRHLIGKPLARLAEDMAAIQPGSQARIQVSPDDLRNEIGSVASSANTFIDAAASALEKVKALATTDELTGLPNRRAFMARLEDERARVQRYAPAPTSILMLDLDHFKQINDQHGHAAGDSVLRCFSATLSAQLRKVDLAGRIGGEEFAILLPDTDTQAASIFAERLRQIVAGTPVDHAGTPISYTVSIGIASLTAADEHAEDALVRADHTLYAAKQAGRNRTAIHGVASAMAR
jgi:diguanylate cyclase (GGDEF)-like protein